MDSEVRMRMEDAQGSSTLGVHIRRAGGKYVCLLMNHDTFLVVIVLQIVKDRVYVECMDSTGYEQGHARRFMLSILKCINPRITSCFSYPKNEYVFGSSSLNKDKRVRMPEDLLNYWISIFEEHHGSVHVWSNNYDRISYPFEHEDELVYFEDDPKQKISRHLNGSITEMFDALLCRTDFVKGSLVYGNTKVYKKSCIKRCCIADIESMIVSLRSMDFSTLDNARQSTNAFLQMYGLQTEYFQSNKAAKRRVTKQEECIMIDVKNKRLVK
ncbi:hypothetical protein M896_010750 [Ordospora colligata OC4]|uniref:Uncharacterized protein n=1 Tax=Ordospora colligata OC4 TaxID=1354746 RepID=A0A0B2UMY2_9MICR|nr:uncharacterized protein M896_010750 [Ordospora colligata OC4]KHN70422.1 hypothetical protein M896_010750 [Ordospora colligata OC4]TBU17172.1 hypothetical protein CWI41_010750 [Ordospora colligata]